MGYQKGQLPGFANNYKIRIKKPSTKIQKLLVQLHNFVRTF